MAHSEVTGQGEFGMLLRMFRATANLTQEELAERSGLSVQAIRALEQGTRRSPRPSTVEWLAEALRLDAGHKRELIAAARGGLVPKEPLHRALESRSAVDIAASVAESQALLASIPTDALP